MTFNEAEFKHVLDFVNEETGISVPDTAHKNLRSYLSLKLKDSGGDIRQYLELVRRDKGEYSEFINEVTINETYFFREERHFKVLESLVLPDLARRDKAVIKLWSASCSTGEEAVSLALIAGNSLSQWPGRDFCVYASDINPAGLARLKSAVYGANSFREDGKSFYHLAEKHSVKVNDGILINNNVIEKIKVYNLNLFSDIIKEIPESLDVIFLRNTLIYMPMPIREKIIGTCAAKLLEGGYLFLSSAEIPLISHPELCVEEHLGTYFFRKKNASDRQHTAQNYTFLLKDMELKRIPVRSENSQKAKQRPDMSRLFELINKRMDNALYRIDDNFYELLCIEYGKILYHINSNDIPEAEKLLNDAEVLTGKNELNHYLEGYLNMVKGEKETAIEKFRHALSYSPGFWPARFYLAKLLLHASPKNGLREANLCAAAINDYLKNGSYLFQVMLEGFNARYFLSILNSWIEKSRRE
jgi:chemotaxis protein methyltransferase CheR